MKTKLKLIALITAILIALAFPAAGAAAVVSPNGSYCLDKVGVISEETKAYITQRNKNLEQNCKGAQMCVVVLDSINGADIEEYAYDVFRSWQIGRSGEDNGVLILMLIKDDDYWIMPGSGLEDVLSEQMLASTINTYCEPSFAAKDYDTAVRKTFERINEELCGFYRVNPDGTANPSLITNDGFVGGGSGSAVSNEYSGGTNAASSCNSPGYSSYSRPSCTSCHALRGCVSCAIACSSCASYAGCGSCGGVGGLLLALVVVYVLIQVLRYMGNVNRVGRVNRSAGSGYYGRPRFFSSWFSPMRRTRYTSYRPPFGGAGRSGSHFASSGNWRPGANNGDSGSGSNPGSGSGRPSGSSGFSGSGGSSRGGGAGRSYSSKRGSTTRSGGFGGFGSSGGFSGGFKGFSGGSPFKGGGGGTRGGGAGRRK